jgi:SpoVK/Ycf46/Vps4 family AAA+-type ATPase
MGGILFVDEAYTLAPQSNSGEKDKFGTEAIEKLMKRMEDDRDKFVVIAAGYQTEMNNFLSANDGLKSRFDRYLHIDDYTPEELLLIFKGQVKKKKYTLDAAAEERLQKAITKIYESREINRLPMPAKCARFVRKKQRAKCRLA